MKITGSTRITGIIGFPLTHTLSPAMQNTAFESVGLDYVYVPMPVKPQDIERAVKSIVPLGICGVNVTIPYKEKVVEFLDCVTEEAKIIGAVNTIENTNNKLIGHNTDAEGFIISLTTDGNVIAENKHVLMIGAGGVARAIGVKLLVEKIASLAVYDIESRKAKELCQRLGKYFPSASIKPINASQINDVLSGADILINATPVGMNEADDRLLVSLNPEKFHKNMFIFDVVYNRETCLLKEARKHRIKSEGGMGMLLYQGALAFEIWTGKKAPIKVIKQVLLENLSVENLPAGNGRERR